MILAQGIPLFEQIPWKTIAVPSITLGFLLAAADFFTRFFQTRESNRLAELQFGLLKDMCDGVNRMGGVATDIHEAVWSLHELTLSNAPVSPYPARKPAAAEHTDDHDVPVEAGANSGTE